MAFRPLTNMEDFAKSLMALIGAAMVVAGVTVAAGLLFRVLWPLFELAAGLE